MTKAQLTQIIREELKAVKDKKKEKKLDEISVGGVDLTPFIPLIGPLAGVIAGYLAISSNKESIKKQLGPNATDKEIKAAAAKALVDKMQKDYGGSSR